MTEFKKKDYLCNPKEQTSIMKSLRLFLLAASVLLLSCGEHQKSDSSNEELTDTLLLRMENGNMMQGLVCDGCNDTIIIFLRQPYHGEDPDTLNILNASKQQQVFGRPHVGDKLTLLLDPADSTRASLVIVLNDLVGQWCYKVKPSLRLRADVKGKTERQQLKQLPDSVKEMLNVELEYGFHLKSDFTVSPIGWKEYGSHNEKDTPVEYPLPPHYDEWQVADGQLILMVTKSDSLQQIQVVAADTVRFKELKDSSLVLHFADGPRTYYRTAK